MNLHDLERQILDLQQQAEAMRTTIDDPELPAVWRKYDSRARWYRYVPLTPQQGELFKQDGWEPLYRRQKAMAEAKARLLARSHKGVALVRATEAHHGIH